MDLPEGWRVWSEATDRVVIVYRPDVFDGTGFPAPCLPTLYVTQGRRGRRPGGERTDTGHWYCILTLEPDVRVTEERFDGRDAAIDGARRLAADLAEGRLDHRRYYQMTDDRESYLDRLDELTGRA